MNGESFILMFDGEVAGHYDTFEAAEQFVHEVNGLNFMVGFEDEYTFMPRFLQVEDDKWEAETEGGTWTIVVI